MSRIKDAEKTSEVYKLIRIIKDAELLDRIGYLAYQEARDIKRKKANNLDWHVDQNVRLQQQYHRTKPFDIVGKVTKVNSIKLKVRFEEYGVYNISKTMLEVVE